MREIHRWSMNSLRKGLVTQKMFHLMTSSYFQFKSTEVMAFLFFATFLAHTWIPNPVTSERDTVGTLNATEYWLPDWEEFKDMRGISLWSEYQFTHLPAREFSWAPNVKVSKTCYSVYKYVNMHGKYSINCIPISFT